HNCVIVGFPGVSYVAGDNGTQVGAPAQRDGAEGKQITLAPGSTAFSPVDAVEVPVFDASDCGPTPVRGFRVYPPDETASLFVSLPAGSEGCARTTTPVPQLSVQTIQPGSGPSAG